VGVQQEMHAAVTRGANVGALDDVNRVRRAAKVRKADVEAVPLKNGEWVCVQAHCGIRNSKADMHCRRCKDPLRFTGGAFPG
jgi:hypothetical protein